MRKNKDWKIIRGEVTSDETILAFFKEVGMNIFNNIGGRKWFVRNDDKTFKAVFRSEKNIKSFTIPQDWIEAKAYILEEDEDLKEGEWYKTNEYDWRFKVESISNHIYKVKDLIYSDNFLERHIIGARSEPLKGGFTKLTHEEKEAHLIEVAKKRGFKEGVQYKWANLLDIRKVTEGEFRLDEEGYLMDETWVIYNPWKGWPEIVEKRDEEQEPTLYEAIEQAEKILHKMNFTSLWETPLRKLISFAKESLKPTISKKEPKEITYSIGDEFEDKVGDKWTLNVWGDCLVGLNRKGLGYDGSHEVKNPYKITQEEAKRIGITKMTKIN